LDRFADDVEWNMQGQIPFSGRRRGREQVREFFALRDRLYRTDRFDVTDFIAQGDQVVVLGAERLTVRETGSHVEDRWAHLLTLREGSIIRADLFHDTWALAAAFGESEAERRTRTGPMGVTEPPFSGHGGLP
ncbi:MAG TPA: nuclear transport factor 2 family protein, partial [Bryobacteraceae bacterium]|nr:nuclear transport factor 2 family protein [Bryobacteraceae bacterium]